MSDEIKDIIEEKVEAPVSAAPAPEQQAPVAPVAAVATPDRPPRRPSGDNDQYQRMPRFKKKVCRFCQDKNLVIDYKETKILEKFVTDRGKILPRRVTGTCSKHQRFVAAAIKRARIIALLPFLEK